jgi:hypothetical protein
VSTITIGSTPDLKCQMCGRETVRLFGYSDGNLEPGEPEHCATCHLEQLAFDEQGAHTELETLRSMVRSMLIHGFAHPDDIRAAVEDACRHVPDWTGNRVETIRAKRHAHAEMLRAEVA